MFPHLPPGVAEAHQGPFTSLTEASHWPRGQWQESEGKPLQFGWRPHSGPGTWRCWCLPPSSEPEGPPCQWPQGGRCPDVDREPPHTGASFLNGAAGRGGSGIRLPTRQEDSRARGVLGGGGDGHSSADLSLQAASPTALNTLA